MDSERRLHTKICHRSKKKRQHLSNLGYVPWHATPCLSHFRIRLQGYCTSQWRTGHQKYRSNKPSKSFSKGPAFRTQLPSSERLGHRILQPSLCSDHQLLSSQRTAQRVLESSCHNYYSLQRIISVFFRSLRLPFLRRSVSP